MEARSITDKTAFVDPLAKFPIEITKIIDTKESIDDKDGCLLVSGTNISGVPLDYYISFNQEDNRWNTAASRWVWMHRANIRTGMPSAAGYDVGNAAGFSAGRKFISESLMKKSSGAVSTILRIKADAA